MFDAGREKYKFLLYQPRTFRQWLVGSREQERMQLKNLTDANVEAAKTFLSNNYDTGGRNMTQALVDDCCTECMMQVLLLWMRATESSDKEFPFQMHELGTSTIQNILSISNPKLETENYQLYSWVCTKLSQIQTKYCSSYYFKPTAELRQDIEKVVPIIRDLSPFLKGKINMMIGNMEYGHMLDDKSNICNVLCQIAEALVGYDNSTDRSIDAMAIFKMLFARIVQAPKNNMIYLYTTNPTEGAQYYTVWDETNTRFAFFKQVVNFYIVTELSHQADIDGTEDPRRKEKVQEAHTLLLNSILAFVNGNEKKDAFTRQLEDHWLITPAETPWFSGRGARRYLNALTFKHTIPAGNGAIVGGIMAGTQLISAVYATLAMFRYLQLAKTPSRVHGAITYTTDLPNLSMESYVFTLLNLARHGYALYRHMQHKEQITIKLHDFVMIGSSLEQALNMYQSNVFEWLQLCCMGVYYEKLFCDTVLGGPDHSPEGYRSFALLSQYVIFLLFFVCVQEAEYQQDMNEQLKLSNGAVVPIAAGGVVLRPLVNLLLPEQYKIGYMVSAGVFHLCWYGASNDGVKLFTSINDLSYTALDIPRRLQYLYETYIREKPEEPLWRQLFKEAKEYIRHQSDIPAQALARLIANVVNSVNTPGRQNIRLVAYHPQNEYLTLPAWRRKV